MGLIILILLVLLLVVAFPTGGYGFGYLSHGIIGTILVIVVILFCPVACEVAMSMDRSLDVDCRE
jgi:hypothetical protein